MDPDRERLLEAIRAAVIGDDRAIDAPYGPVRLAYADYTASGRALAFLEDFIRAEVLPLYANTHTESSWTGRQTSRFREDARRIIRDAVGGGDQDAVIFCGSGATAAIDKLIGVFELRRRAAGEPGGGGGVEGGAAADRPAVFIGPYEHHSNELPWREADVDLVAIDEDRDGGIDVEMLGRALQAHAGRRLLLGSFSAASNVTGILSDVRRVTGILHDHGALACWDYAAAAPYLRIDMNPRTAGGAADARAALDAVFLSPHKFVGGPGTPGVLVIKRALLRNRVPVVPGGGTVAYVGPTEHVYLADPELREEGGTPAILDSIRAGLVLQLQQQVGLDVIHEREESFVRRALAAWAEEPNLDVLGNPRAPRLGIMSFRIQHGERWLHHHFVVALLNDLFGIQARSGCSCAGPYGHRLLGIDVATSHEFEREIVRGHEGIKPGWARLGFNYFLSEALFEYLVEAVRLVARWGWRLLPDYRFDPSTGLWTHAGGGPEPRRLHEVRYDHGRLRFEAPHATLSEDVLPAQLERARERLRAGATHAGLDHGPTRLDPGCERLRWFPLPWEVQRELAGGGD